MNNVQWNSSKNALEMLEALKSFSIDKFMSKTHELQCFYIACCKQKLSLLPQKDFKLSLDLAEAYINGKATSEEINETNWYTEAAVFGMDYDEEPYENEHVYKNISITLGLSMDNAKNYAIKLGYFIDWTSLYATSFNGRIPEKYSLFLNADLLRKEIAEPFDE